MMYTTFTGLIILCSAYMARSAYDIAFGSDDDMTRFVTRPEIRAPLFNVEYHDRAAVAPGYWFIGVYANIEQYPHAKNYLQPCQTGPHIYDGDGELIWSGACSVNNQNAADFRVWTANGSDHLSWIQVAAPTKGDAQGHGVVLNSQFGTTHRFYVPPTMYNFNMHELNIVNDGSSVLHLLRDTKHVSTADVDPHHKTGLIADLGFCERDLRTGETLFEWWASDHIPLTASTTKPTQLEGPWPGGWNWIHLNSIDKSADGDYMICSRYTNAIYKISGQTGAILWTLGGNNSSFVLESGFNFSRQHDARFLESNFTTDVISFLDNGGDADGWQTSSRSSALVVALDKTAEPQTARVLRRWNRPDDGISRLRGNFQLLPNGNAFVGWSDDCYLSEHTDDGRLLMEARFASERMVTYRAYKGNFTSIPSSKPTLKTFVYGEDAESSTTVSYVSWNGATEVSQWRFYSLQGGKAHLVGERKRSGFETNVQIRGHFEKMIAEAVSQNGTSLGWSATSSPEVPIAWGTASDQPKADNFDLASGRDLQELLAARDEL